MNINGWWQLAIALDQLLHCVFYFGTAMADETYSARCWRERQMTPASRWFAWRVTAIDWLAEKFGDGNNHCLRSFQSERDRAQLPAAYQNNP